MALKLLNGLLFSDYLLEFLLNHPKPFEAIAIYIAKAPIKIALALFILAYYRIATI